MTFFYTETKIIKNNSKQQYKTASVYMYLLLVSFRNGTNGGGIVGCKVVPVWFNTRDGPVVVGGPFGNTRQERLTTNKRIDKNTLKQLEEVGLSKLGPFVVHDLPPGS